MIRFATLLLAAAALISSLQAGEPPASTSYVTAVSGIVCQECKAKITFSMKKLPGVKDVTFAKGEKPGEQKVTFASSSGTLEKKDVVKALGDTVEEFTILTFEKVKP